MTIKCIFEENIMNPCNKPAEYIYAGYSYCLQHYKKVKERGV